MDDGRAGALIASETCSSAGDAASSGEANDTAPISQLTRKILIRGAAQRKFGSGCNHEASGFSPFATAAL